MLTFQIQTPFPRYSVQQQSLPSSGRSTWFKCLLDIVGTITIAATPPLESKPYPARFAMLIATAYSSNLVSHLTVPIYSTKLDSIPDLVRTGIYWTAPFPQPVEQVFSFKVSIQDTASRIKKRCMSERRTDLNYKQE